MERIRPLAVAGALMAALPAQSAIVIDAAEVGPDVVFSYTGSFDLSGLTATGAVNNNELIDPSTGAILFAGAGPFDAYEVPSLEVFGPGGTAIGTATGDTFNVYTSDIVGFAVGYAGGPISGDLTLSGETFASLGVLEGTYASVAFNGETITLYIGAVVVPLPAALPLLAGALFGLGALRRRR